MTVTLKDIAQRVGKSVTTVSRALHDFDDVSSATKAEVRSIADELGYIPNIYAQRLQKKRTDTIGFIMPTFGPRFSDPFFSEFLAGIGNQAANLGFDLLVSTRPPGTMELQAYEKNVRSPRVDGFIIVRTRQQDQRIKFLSQMKVPFVAFGRMLDHNDYVYVDEDGEYGMGLITCHLADLGHKRIAYLDAPAHFMFAHYRRQGFLAGLKDNNIENDPELMVTGDMTQRAGYQLATELLMQENPPTAIVACNDLMALGAISAAQQLGLIVGKDLAVTGFDNIPLAEHCHPPLTTVHQPIYQIGEMVCEMLIKQIRAEPLEQRQIILQPSLMVRQSTMGTKNKLKSDEKEVVLSKIV
ncbi:MAG: LacI family DNA-binding transcriptional regulator [Anaerolineales bacterium]|nr:LacI family DNA-binding transcriptional regulator [Anaerolineales bacterium]